MAEASIEQGRLMLGANGGTGRAVVEALLAQGRSVRAVRGVGRIEPVEAWQAAADVTDPAQLAQVFDGVDVVYHCAQPEYLRWTEEFPA